MLKTIAKGTIKTLSTVGLEMPADFPISEYEKLHKHVVTRNGKRKIDETVLSQFLGGWCAVAYRFKATAEHDDSFIQAIKLAEVNLTMENRYVQERELFGFFVTGLSVIESIGYATFALISMVSAHDFPVQTINERRRVTPEVLGIKLASVYPHEPITNAWNSFLQTAEFAELKTIRNTITHRTSPPRLVTSSGSIDYQTGETSEITVTEEWKEFGIIIDTSTTSERRKWLAQSVTAMLAAANNFGGNYF